MANKPLKSIKFPGLSDTYTVPEVDDTLAVTGAAADAKKVGDEISDIKEDLGDLANLETEDKSSLVAAVNVAHSEAVAAAKTATDLGLSVVDGMLQVTYE